MAERLYDRNRAEVFQECGLKPSDKKHNCHHIYERQDLKHHRVPKGFPINCRENLIPLPKDVHAELHEIVENNPVYRKDISLRVYFANMAFCGDLCDVPERGYQSFPNDLVKR